VLLAWIAYGLGVFDKSLSLYANRGMEETGRLLIWPAAFKRYLTSPWVGFGASDSATPLPEHNVWVTPHNQFLMVALASGIIPLTFFIAYWVKAGIDVWRLNLRAHEDAAFLVPMFVYVFLIGLELNQPYMNPWAMVTIGTIAAEAFRFKASRVAYRRSAHDLQRQRGAIVPLGTKA
jgi:O-antigen ligase